LQWLFDENDEQLLYVSGIRKKKIAGSSGSAVWSAVKKKLMKKKIS